jgi:hypothetical protein
MKLEFFRQVFKKYSNIKFHEYLSSGSRVVPSGWTDGHDEPNSPFSNKAPILNTYVRVSVLKLYPEHHQEDFPSQKQVQV